MKNLCSKALFLTVAGSGFLMLSGCAAEPPAPVVVPAVVPINVVDGTVPQVAGSLENCHLQGQVLVRTVDRFKPHNLLITQDEMSELRRKAAALNANSVIIRQNHVVYDKGMYVHVVNADAYVCYTHSY